MTRHANRGLDRQRSRKPIPPDYDRDPGRFRFARSVLHRHALAPDIHERVAGRLPWESVDRRLADAAPAVPLFNRQHLTLVSDRVENVQHHQLWGVLYDQLWVK